MEKLVRIEFVRGSLRPAWFEGETWILFKDLKKIGGKVLVKGMDAEGVEYPLITDEGYAFSFEEQLKFLLNQEYVVRKKPLIAGLPFHYHKIPFRIFLNKMLFRLKKKEKKGFPGWPVAPAADVLLHMQGMLARRKNITWPHGKKYAFWLTHDVDTGKGLRLLPRFLELEEKYGIRSTNFLVGKYYDMPGEILEKVRHGRHEIGLHGDTHDALLPYLSREQILNRLDACRSFMDENEITGFRAPSLLVSEELDKVVEKRFAYDSSIPDTELHMPDSDASGCCSVFPFFQGNLLKIPITLPMDSSLIFLGYTPEEILKLWLEKLAWIKKLGGIVTVVTHSEKHFSANPEMLGVYQSLLEMIAADREVWIATGKEVFQHLKKVQHVPKIN